MPVVFAVASPVARVVRVVGTVVVSRVWFVAVLAVVVMKRNYSKLFIFSFISYYVFYHIIFYW